MTIATQASEEGLTILHNIECKGVILGSDLERARYGRIVRLVQMGAEVILNAMINADTTGLTYRLIDRATDELRGN